MDGRAERLQEELRLHGAEGFLVTSLNNVRYLSGFTGTSGCVLLTAGRRFLLTDSRYRLQASGEARGFAIKVYRRHVEGIAGVIRGLGLKKVGFEAKALSYDTYQRLRRLLPSVGLKSTTDVVEKKRAVKEPFEIERIRRAAEVGDAGFRSVERRRLSGMTEKDVALSIEVAVRRKGAEAMAFDTIVASGKRSALPHGMASEKEIKRGEFVIVDMGVTLAGYKSDKTRTYAVGRATPFQRKIYNIVKAAQEKAIDKVKAGVAGRGVDRAARDYIAKAGYSKFFAHSTGHGIGLDVHEKPSINPQSQDVLEEGMVVTVEPGVYIRDFGGVRIEDMLLVERDGCEVLSGGARELRILE